MCISFKLGMYISCLTEYCCIYIFQHSILRIIKCIHCEQLNTCIITSGNNNDTILLGSLYHLSGICDYNWRLNWNKVIQLIASCKMSHYNFKKITVVPTAKVIYGMDIRFRDHFLTVVQFPRYLLCNLVDPYPNTDGQAPFAKYTPTRPINNRLSLIVP